VSGERTHREDQWLWGWDPTPGIVSVYAERSGRAHVWRRDPTTRALTHDVVRFRPWVVLASLDDLVHLGSRLVPGSREAPFDAITYRELRGDGALRFVVRGPDLRALTREILHGASKRVGRELLRLGDLGDDAVLVLPPDEQYLVDTGRTYFRGLSFESLTRLQFDLETTGLDPSRDRIFLVAVRVSDGREFVLETRDPNEPRAEADLLERLAALIREVDPDVIENHNLHGFDLPFVVRRARILGLRLDLSRIAGHPLQKRAAMRGLAEDENEIRRDDMRRAPRIRFTMPGRELIDTMDAVRRYDFGSRDLGSHGLKSVARHFGLASPDREYVPGPRIYETWRTDPDRVRRYALDDVREVDGIARLLGGSAFALARMAPRRYERLADAGPATGVIDPLLVRAYLRESAAIPARTVGDGTVHSGAALHLFAAGMAQRVVKADVASLYPSLMREYRIGPQCDRLGVMLALVDRLVDQRLAAKSRAKAAPSGSAERHTNEALSSAMKIVVNSAYGYMGAVGLTRFADVHAANEITRRGRELLALLCRELAARGVTLLEADTDGVYFAVPADWTEADERGAVAEVAALLPERVRLEFEGRYAAMLSHEPKNYALLHHDGALTLRGVAFRSSRAEPFGERFLRDAIRHLLTGDVHATREVFVMMHLALCRRALPTFDVSMRVRLTKDPLQYLAIRDRRRELPYEALLAAGRTQWRVGDRIRVYRANGGRAGLLDEREEDEEISLRHDPRDYDVDYYARILRDNFATRLATAFPPDVFAAIVADPTQPSLFERSLREESPRLVVLETTA
jgi:DNA polymerase elongation subunit (family B)